MLFEKKYEEKRLCLRVHFNRRMDRQPFDILHIGVHDFMFVIFYIKGGVEEEEED